MNKIYTDGEVNAALAAKWVADGGGPDDGYKIVEIRDLLCSIINGLNALREALELPTSSAEVKAALEKLEGNHDHKFWGFCWPDIADACWDIVEAVEAKPKKQTRKVKKVRKK